MNSFEQKLKEAFINTLKENGYPAASLIDGWDTTRSYFDADVAVIPPTSRVPIAFFKFYAAVEANMYKPEEKAVSRKEIKSVRHIPCYIVFPGAQEGTYRLMDVTPFVYGCTEFSVEEVKKRGFLEEIPSYKALVTKAAAYIVEDDSRKKKKYSIGLRILCWLLIPGAAVALLLADMLGKYVLTTERLVVMGVVTVILFVPFFSKLSLKNISFVLDNGEKD